MTQPRPTQLVSLCGKHRPAPWCNDCRAIARASRAINEQVDDTVLRRAAEGQPDAEEEIARTVFWAAEKALR